MIWLIAQRLEEMSLSLKRNRMQINENEWLALVGVALLERRLSTGRLQVYTSNSLLLSTVLYFISVVISVSHWKVKGVGT